MSLLTRYLRRSFGLPAPRARRVRVARGVGVPMPDGTVLRHDHHRPAGISRGPVVLVRTPYGRGAPIGLVYGGLVAERGWQVVVQAVRGTGGSGGELAPFDERDDGVATVRWLAAQPWCDGRVATLGASYLGLTQWALAPDSSDAVVAMGLTVTASQFRDQTYPGGSFSLDNALSWSALMSDLARGPLAVLRRRAGDHRLADAFTGLGRGDPLGEADVAVTGGEVPWWDDWLAESAADSPYWARRSSAGRVGEVAAAGVDVASVAGWQDIFLPWQLADAAALRAAGGRPRLVIGPWTHSSPEVMGAGLREALALFDRRLGGDGVDGPLAATTGALPVTVELSGGGGRRSLPDWPPPSTPYPLHLHPGGRLDPGAPPAVPDVGTAVPYDPRDPTPAVGGPILEGDSGAQDQEALEARTDVAVFTGGILTADLVALGPARATVHLDAEVEHVDVFVRVCDVDADGRSVNVTDGLVRVAPGAPPRAADGTLAVEVELWPTGHRFAAGHRLRVQISGGAHPRFVRHPGTDAGLGAPTALVARLRTVRHDAAHPSHVLLAVEGSPRSSSHGR